jgi:hypothetical protein
LLDRQATLREFLIRETRDLVSVLIAGFYLIPKCFECRAGRIMFKIVFRDPEVMGEYAITDEWRQKLLGTLYILNTSNDFLYFSDLGKGVGTRETQQITNTFRPCL